MPNSHRMCKQCKKYVEEWIRHPSGIFCGHDHAIKWAVNKNIKAAEKNQRRSTREAKERLKTKGDHLKDAQKAFNAFIRERDSGHACISCGRKTGAKQNAGHYRSVGAAPELRFNEHNCHLQCEHCNSWKSGNAIDYRINLVKKIGVARVEWLEGPHPPARLRIEDINQIKKKYKDKIKALKACTERS